jgi:tRNA nucleotidyltransferase (CCA-adding enzyme)
MEVLNQFLTRTLDAQQRELLANLTENLEIWNVNGQDIAIGTAVAEEYVDSASVLTHYIVEDMGYRVAIALVEMPDRLQVVARSRINDVDVGAVLSRIGGGGHAQAASAGFKDSTLKEVLTSVREALEDEVRAPLNAREIMSSPVRTIDPETTMVDARDKMMRWGHGGLPVILDGKLAGLVTRKDVDKATRHGLEHAPVKGFMARDVTTVGLDASLQTLERILAGQGIGRVPVLEGDQIVGIVTRKDLLRAEHGDEYLDRRLPRAHAESGKRFLSSVDSLLPPKAESALREIGDLAQSEGLRAHVVGGFVRDMLLGTKNLDMDVVVEGDAVSFAEKAAEHFDARVKVHRRFGTAVLVLSPQLHVDITSARTEYYTRPGALPTVERSSLRQDLFRRDFSVNAMAACINPECFGTIADPFGGLSDLKRGVLRVLHSLSFVEDPTRVLRGARFESKYSFSMDASTEELARQAVEMNMLSEVGGARIREEMLDIIDEDDPAGIFERLDDLGVASVLVPEEADVPKTVAGLATTQRAYKVLARRFERLPRRRVALVASLAGTSNRSHAERWLNHLRFGREYSDPAIVVAERGHALTRRLDDGRKMKDSRLYRTLEGVPSESVVFLWGACSERGRGRIERYLDVLDKVRPEVTGDDLLEMGLQPSAGFSDILGQALDDRLDGKAIGRDSELANLKRIARRHSNS